MSTELQFDDYGYLTPYEPVSISIATFEELFVIAFPDSATRKPLFEQYKEFTRLIDKILPQGYTQWVDGSFVSHKLNPNDIDVVTFVDAQLYDRYEKEFDELREWRNQKPKLVDGFFVRYYPENHRYRVRYDYDCVDWLNTFGAWKDRNLKTRNKGFITLKF